MATIQTTNPHRQQCFQPSSAPCLLNFITVSPVLEIEGSQGGLEVEVQKRVIFILQHNIADGRWRLCKCMISPLCHVHGYYTQTVPSSLRSQLWSLWTDATFTHLWLQNVCVGVLSFHCCFLWTTPKWLPLIFFNRLIFTLLLPAGRWSLLNCIPFSYCYCKFFFCCILRKSLLNQ